MLFSHIYAILLIDFKKWEIILSQLFSFNINVECHSPYIHAIDTVVMTSVFALD